MSNYTYQRTNYRIGTIKSVFDDKGYGFITSLDRDYAGEMFFHYRQLLSETIQPKQIVAYLMTESDRHIGKKEAVKVVKLRDIVDLKKLIQLYLKYAYVNIINQIAALSSEDTQGQNPAGILFDVFENELTGLTATADVPKLRRIIRVARILPNLEPETLLTLQRQLLIKNPEVVHQLYFDVYKDLKNDSLLEQVDIIALYNELPEKEKPASFAKLTLTERVQLVPLSAINSDNDFKRLLNVVKVANENAGENFSALNGVDIAPYYFPLLWLNDLVEDFPQSGLRALITAYPQTIQQEFIAKMSIDQKVVTFPFQEIKSEADYLLFKLFFYGAQDCNLTFDAFILSGLKIENSFICRAVEDDLCLVENAGMNNIASALSASSPSKHKKLAKLIGWKQLIDIYKDKLLLGNFDLLKEILSIVPAIGSEEVVELKQMVPLSPTQEYALFNATLLPRPAPDVSARIFLETINSKASERILIEHFQEKGALFLACVELFRKEPEFNTEVFALKILNSALKHVPQMFEHIRQQIEEAGKEWLKIYLWLADFCEKFDFISYRNYFIFLSASDQKKFIKKLFWQMKNFPGSIALDDILSMRSCVPDLDFARSTSDKDHKVDFTIYVILEAIDELRRGSILKPERIYSIIANQIRDAEEILVLTGFFEKCPGRAMAKQEYTGEGAKPEFTIERTDVPRFSPYCAGRKALIRQTNEPAVCERTGLQFWWCNNAKCYEACVVRHQHWQEYTLLDFLEISLVPYNELDYEVFLGYVNKVNHFLSHMKCHGCSRILKPHEKNHQRLYGFHRVSHFSCDNPDCQKNTEIIYLSHCINGHCGGIIDSRESAKCKPNNRGDGNCGWYVCKYCYACCNSDGIKRRSQVLLSLGQEYKCPEEGHRDRGKICCIECGFEMEEDNAGNEGDYQRVLNWFLKKRTTSSFIINSGQRRDGKYWFTLRAPVGDDSHRKAFRDKLYRYVAVGFNVPDINEEKESYLLAESGSNARPGPRVLKCTHCEHKLTLISDFERYAAMIKYHHHLFLTAENR